MLTAEGISHRYKAQQSLVLDGVSLQLNEGEIVGVFGKSGSGKTTLLRILAGLLRPSDGRVIVDGKPLCAPTPQIGLMYQSYALFEWKTCYQNIEVAVQMATRRKPPQQLVISFLDLVGLVEHAHVFPGELSGGMRQRLALARAMSVSPRLILLDEPFSALDVHTKSSIVNATFALIKERKAGAMIVSHDVEGLLPYCDRALVLRGKPAGLSNVTSLRDDTRTALEVTRAIADAIQNGDAPHVD